MLFVGEINVLEASQPERHFALFDHYRQDVFACVDGISDFIFDVLRLDRFRREDDQESGTGAQCLSNSSSQRAPVGMSS